MYTGTAHAIFAVHIYPLSKKGLNIVKVSVSTRL
jgi:hypothetical protein